MKERPPYRSYSQLTEWMKCGESYRLTRRVGVKEKPSVWLPGGTAFHNTSERFDRNDLTNGLLSQTWFEEWQKALDAQIEKAEEEYKDPATWRVAGKGKETLAWWENSGLNWANAYAEWRERSDLQIIDIGEIELIEAELMPVLNGVPVKMYPDRVMVDKYGQAIVVDLKTGSSDQPSTLQLGVYKVGVEALLSIRVEWGAFYNARKGELSPPARLDQWTEERVGQLFETFDKQERSGDYLPNIGRHCKYECSVKQWCVYQGGTKHPEDG